MAKDSRLKKYPRVFIIILNWNQLDLTLECIASLAGQDYENYTTIVVDNGSTDGSPDVILDNYPKVVMLTLEENLGYSQGNNIGMRYALEHGADYLFLLNNDTTVAPDMLRLLVDATEADPEIGMSGPTMYYFDQPNRIAAAGSMIDRQRGTFRHLDDGKIESEPNGPVKEVDFIVSCGVLVKREVVDKIGLFDTRYFINGEDIDWGWKTQKAGYKVVYLPSARMWHKISATMGQASPSTTYYTTRNTLLLFSTHQSGLSKMRSLAFIWFRSLRTISAWTLKAQYRHQGFHRKRDANLFALRDAVLGRFGMMGPDVSAICYPKVVR